MSTYNAPLGNLSVFDSSLFQSKVETSEDTVKLQGNQKIEGFKSFSEDVTTAGTFRGSLNVAVDKRCEIRGMVVHTYGDVAGGAFALFSANFDGGASNPALYQDENGITQIGCSTKTAFKIGTESMITFKAGGAIETADGIGESVTSLANGTIVATSSITGGSLTDGTATLSSGSLTNATSVNASGAVTCGSLTDGTATLSSGSLTGVTSVNVDGVIDATTVNASNLMTTNTMQTIGPAKTFYDLRVGNADDTKWHFTQGSDSNLYLQHFSNPNATVYINNTFEAPGITSNLNVDGVIDGQTLKINNTTFQNTAGVNGLFIRAFNGDLSINVGGDLNILYSYPHGHVYLGNATNLSNLTLRCVNQQLHLAGYSTQGDMGLTNNGRVITTSDIRLKENIVEYTAPSVEKIMRLKPKYYDWKADNGRGQSQLGFIADDVQDIIVECVDGKKYGYEWEKDEFGEPILDGSGNLIMTDVIRYKSFSIRPMVCVIVKAMQEQQHLIVTMEAKMEEQTATIASILKRLDDAGI